MSCNNYDEENPRTKIKKCSTTTTDSDASSDELNMLKKTAELIECVIQKNNESIPEKISSFGKFIMSSLTEIKDESVVDNFCSGAIMLLFEAKKKYREQQL